MNFMFLMQLQSYYSLLEEQLLSDKSVALLNMIHSRSCKTTFVT